MDSLKKQDFNGFNMFKNILNIKELVMEIFNYNVKLNLLKNYI